MGARWLSTMVPDGRGFLLPGLPAGHTADLQVAEAGLTLRAGDAEARLAWQDHRSDAPTFAMHRPHGWWVTYTNEDRSGESGVSIELAGPTLAEAEAVRAATSTRRNRFARIFDHRTIVPLWSRTVVMRDDLKERATFTALLALLAERPAMRARLAEPDRVAQLAEDLAGGVLGPKGEPNGFRRKTFEALAAMRALGYRHPFGGRPVPGDPLDPLDEIVERVVNRVAANPYALLTLDPAKVAKLVRRHYLDVEPWPFAALTGRPVRRRRHRHLVTDPTATGHRPSWWGRRLSE